MRLLVAVAKHLLEKQGSSINKEKIKNMLGDLVKRNIYKPRSVPSHNNIKRKISLLCYFIIGYWNRNKSSFVFSPLGKLYLDNFYAENPTSRNYVFLSLLFSIQYPHPHSGSPPCQLFPFRLIFKLLTDSRLGNILYNYEIFMLIIKTKNNIQESYEKL